MNTLMFRNTALKTLSHKDQIWFTSAELAKALQYANPKSVTNLYNQNIDEFSAGMTEVIESVTSIKSIRYGLLQNKTRIFSLRGAHLIAMFANTPIAKEFRKWCLDILDKEVGVPAYQPQSPEVFNGNDLNNLARLVWEMSHGFRFDNSWRHGIWSALRRVTGIPSPKPF
ncbi:BRO-N domain-containing protein [Candidatus Hamiltonella endosymbiont of Tuberolachnus salignus]|uniref:BRO-N domain-containing protein n=1 Tax=Candidatus Williamhamiltonella endosymbiont of Tuberolachnus salignus TaxID=3077954 RepID=UPI0030D453DE